MTTPIRSLEDTIALGVSQWGVRWPNAWWPGQDNDANDCAAFQSWLLWGLNEYGGPRNIWVSDIQLRNGLEFHQYSDGIQRGDIVGWYWGGAEPGSYDHTGIVTRVDGNTVYTLDANSGPGDCVGEYGRSRGYITSYVRPNYPNTTGAGIPGSSIPNTRTKDDPMYLINAVDRGVALVGTNMFVSLAPGEEVEAGKQLATVDYGVIGQGRWDTIRDICTRGDRHFIPANVPAWRVAGGGTSGGLSASDLAKIDALDDDETSAILAAVAAIKTGDNSAILTAVNALPAKLRADLGAALANG